MKLHNKIISKLSYLLADDQDYENEIISDLYVLKEYIQKLEKHNDWLEKRLIKLQVHQLPKGK